MELHKFTQEDVSGKRIILRCDLDVKVNDKGIVDQYHDLRLERVTKTLSVLFTFGVKQVVMIGHRGRTNGIKDKNLSLIPVRDRLGDLCLSENIDIPITFVDDIMLNPIEYINSELIMLENLRFWPGEKTQDQDFAKSLSKWGEVYINDAFGNSHRNDTSMSILPTIMSSHFAGPELVSEVMHLEKFVQSIQNPYVAILGGAKISTKLPLLSVLSRQADTILLGGGLANTMLASRGNNMQKSLVEESELDRARKISTKKIILPVDAVVAKGKTISISELSTNDAMLDIGPNTIKKCVQHLSGAKTILWNGPLGVFEKDEFSSGTYEIAIAIAKNKQAYTLAGGGETLEILEILGLVDDFSYVSTGGGAMLSFLVDQAMPGLETMHG